MDGSIYSDVSIETEDKSYTSDPLINNQGQPDAVINNPDAGESQTQLIGKVKNQLNCLDVLKHFKIEYDRNRITCPIPGHIGNQQSFSLEDNNANFKCLECDKKGDCIALYGLLSGKGFKSSLQDLAFMAGLRKEPAAPEKKHIATYQYEHADKSPCFQVLYYEPYEIKLRKNEHEWGIRDVQCVLYRLPRLIAAKNAGQEIFPCECEKDVETLFKNGLTATCNAGGAISGVNDGKWKSGYTDTLTGCHLIILADKDEQGRTHAESLAMIMNGKAASIKIVELPDKDGNQVKDATDFFDAGGTVEEFKDIVAQAKEWEPDPNNPMPVVITSVSDMEILKSKYFDIIKDKNIPQAAKNTQIANTVCRFLMNRGRFFHHEKVKTLDKTMYYDRKTRRLYNIYSDEFKGWLSKYTGINLKDTLFEYIQSAIGTEALSGETTGVIPEKFWTSRQNAVYLSCGPEKLVKITKYNYVVMDNGTDDVLFDPRYVLEKWAITDPVDPFFTCSLFSKANYVFRTGLDLLRVWAMSLPKSTKTKPPLLLTGNIGSGKTKIAMGLSELYGIPSSLTTLDERKPDNLWTAMNDGGIACLDNVDSGTSWLADALASASTGVGLKKRKLYHDDVNITLNPDAWVILTSANPTFAADPGLSDRMLVIRLNRIMKGTSDSKLIQEIRDNRNAGLCFICQAISKALADHDKTPFNLNKRHPDFARFAVKLGRAIGREAAVIEALQSAEMDKSLTNLENDELGMSIINLLEKEDSFTGSISDLLDKIKEREPDFDMTEWNSRKAGWRISKLWPHIRELYDAEQMKKNNTRNIRISRRDGDISTGRALTWDECIPRTPTTNEPPVQGVNEVLTPEEEGLPDLDLGI